MSVIEQEEIQSGAEEVVVTVTDSAATVIRNLLEQRQIPNHVLRVFVSGGGCSGMQYGMAFEEMPQEYDTIVAGDGFRLIIDPTSMMYLQGSVIDFVDSLVGGGFRIDNPNAVSSCGCGKSFKSNDQAADDTADAGCGTCGSY